MAHEEIATEPVRRWLGHVRVLADDIGPRGSTTDGERRGHDYVERALQSMGLRPGRDEFDSPRSIFLPHLLGGLLMLLAFAIYPWAGRVSAVAAAMLSILTIANELLELSFRDNLLRRVLPKGRSQNVYAVVDPAGEHLRDVVLVGHVDTQHTPLVFRSARWVRAYAIFTFVVFVAFAAQAALYVFGAITLWSWIWPATVPGAVVTVLLVAMCAEAERSPYTPGANDNASAVGLVLALAERYARRPLRHTRIWVVATGCEEAGHGGMLDFYRRYRDQLRNPVAIPFELIGVAGPAYQTLEGVVVPFRADRRLVALCDRLANKHPEWRAYEIKVTGGNTEMADAVRYDVPAIAITGVTRDLVGPYWHQLTDTADKMNPDAMGRTYAMVTTLLETLDTEGLN